MARPASGSMDNGLNCTDCTYSYTWQRCNVDLERLRRRSRRAPATRTCSAPTTSASGSASSSGSSSATAVRTTPRPARSSATTSRRTARPAPTVPRSSRSRSSTPQFTGTPRPCRARRWRTRSSARPGRRGPGRGRSRRRSSGSAATRPVRAARRSRVRPARRTASPPGDVGRADPRGRDRVERGRNLAGGVGSDRGRGRAHADGAPARRLPRHEGHAAPPPRARTRWSRSRRATTVTLRVKVSDDRGFRVGGVQVRVTPTGLLAGPAAARTSAANGWATFTFRATGTGTTYVFVEARRKGEKPQAGHLDLEPVQGARPLGRFSPRRVSAETPSENLEMRPFLPSGRKGRGQSQRSPLFMLSRALLASSWPHWPSRSSSWRTPAPRRRRIEHAGERDRHPPWSARS